MQQRGKGWGGSFIRTYLTVGEMNVIAAFIEEFHA